MADKKTPPTEPTELELANARIAELEAALKSKASSSQIDTLDAFERKFKPLIGQKMAAGLTREQAVSAIRNQLREDKANKSDIAEQMLKSARGE